MPAKVDAVSPIAGRPWLVPLGLDPERDRDEWVAARVAGLGGSDAPALINEHPFKSLVDVWQEKIGDTVPFLDNDRTRVGRLLEPTVLGWYEIGDPAWNRPGGELVIAKPPTCYHRDRPWHRGSPDGLVYYPEAVSCLRGSLNGRPVDVELLRVLQPDHMVEVKTHGWFAARAYGGRIVELDTVRWGEEGCHLDVPADKRIQCAWYMELFDIERCHLLALVDTHIQRTFVIHRDREIGAYLLEEADRFWRHNVLTGEPPDPDGSEAFGRYVSHRFKQKRPDLLLASPEVNDATRRLLRTKRAQKKLEDIREKLEQQIKVFIGEETGVRTVYGAITWKSQPNSKLKEKEARATLYQIAGLTDDEIEAFEVRFRQPEYRVMRTPK